MTDRTASCRCGKLRATVTGEPVRVSVCHCINCKKRSGSAFAAQARWPKPSVRIEGESRTFEMTGDSGNRGIFHFCAACGSDVYYLIEGPSVDPKLADSVAIPLGAFDDPYFLRPRFSVWEGRKHDWLEIVGADIEHWD
jgi:hypothetical protein